MQSEVQIPIDSFSLEGLLTIPEKSTSLVLFVHGSGSSRFSPRNNFVANILNEGNIATLLIDLLSEKEDAVYETRFDIDLLTERVIAIIKWLKQHKDTSTMSLGLFGSSTGAAAALMAAARQPENIQAVVSRGGRPGLAKTSLKRVNAPTLLIVGEKDFEVIKLNQSAFTMLSAKKKLEIVPGATHLFEEPGCLEIVSKLAQNWFTTYLKL
ncbi:MAG: dienelactone hydrolase family protein [Chlamydiota bacterium]|jgi:putative phosphoribosyl transferase